LRGATIPETGITSPTFPSMKPHALPNLLICCALILSALFSASSRAQTTNAPSPDTNLATVSSASSASATNRPPDVTPTAIPGTEAMVFRKAGDTELRLFIVKPKDWSPSDKRSCLVSFFGGGWNSGTPNHSIGYAKWAATQGMVGIAPDYRTRNRFQTTPETCVADGRAAVRWIQDHAAELGIDSTKIVSLGQSAGGHVAAWTAISDPLNSASTSDPVPDSQPAALILLWPVTDTTITGYGGPRRFDNDAARAAALSVPLRMPAKMPPTIIFHGTGDKIVKFDNSVAFQEKMKSNGNTCSLTAFPDAPHTPTNVPDPKGKECRMQMAEEMQKFLLGLGLIKSSEASPVAR